MPIHLNIADLAEFWIGSGRMEKYTCCSDRSAIRPRQSDFSTSPCSCSGVVEPVRPSWALLLSSVCQRPSCDWQFGAELRRAFQVVVCLTGSMSRFTFPPPPHTHTHFPFSAVSLSFSLTLPIHTPTQSSLSHTDKRICMHQEDIGGSGSHAPVLTLKGSQEVTGAGGGHHRDGRTLTVRVQLWRRDRLTPNASY